MSVIKVDFKVCANTWHINKILKKLSKYKILSLDTETRGVYSKLERKEAKEYLKNRDITVSNKALALQIAANSGLSFPSLVNVTHFVFGISESESVILICTTPRLEVLIWEWVHRYTGIFLIHNTLFDLKLMYYRIGEYPKNYEDTQLLAKSLVNNAEVWKAKVDLKTLMGSFYEPSWSLYNEYEPDDLKDNKFLNYMAIDGAATYKLWFDIKDFTEK